MKVFINPGHCPNIDPGAIGKITTEAEICAKLGELVKHYLCIAGLTCNLLQDDNLNEVTTASNDWGTDLFVSIHCNGFSDPNANGTEVLCYSRDSESEKLAMLIQSQLISTIHTTDRGIKERPGLCVLRATNCTAVLVETAFITNPKEEQLLLEFTDDIARAIARGVTDYICTL